MSCFRAGLRCGALLVVAMPAQDLSHRDINQRLGEASDYTAAVEAFLGSLDESVATLLGRGRLSRH